MSRVQLGHVTALKSGRPDGSAIDGLTRSYGWDATAGRTSQVAG